MRGHWYGVICSFLLSGVYAPPINFALHALATACTYVWISDKHVRIILYSFTGWQTIPHDKIHDCTWGMCFSPSFVMRCFPLLPCIYMCKYSVRIIMYMYMYNM